MIFRLLSGFRPIGAFHSISSYLPLRWGLRWGQANLRGWGQDNVAGEKLTAAKAKGALAPGRYLDGAGLYLQVKPSGARSWIFRYKVARKPKFMGLGPFPAVSLAKAREKANEARKVRAEGSDPIRQKIRADAQAARETAGAITFERAALECIAAKQGEWRSPKTAYIITR